MSTANKRRVVSTAASVQEMISYNSSRPRIRSRLPIDRCGKDTLVKSSTLYINWPFAAFQPKHDSYFAGEQ